MPDTKKQRSVSINADAYLQFEQAASAAGESVAAYLTKAGDDRRRREEAAAYAAYCAQPEIAEQIGLFLGGTHLRMAAWRAKVDAA